MLKNYFSEIREGRLARLQYLGHFLILSLLGVVFMFAIVLAIGAGEHLVGGDLQQAQDKLRDWFSLPLMVVCILVSALFVFAGANIMAKRIRDIGLPGWWTMLIFIVLGGIISAMVSNQAGSGFNTLTWFIMLLIPGNTFGKNN